MCDVGATDVIVVCPRPFAAELSPWIEHRRGQGIECLVIQPQSDSASTLSAIQAVAKANTRYVMIIGDAPQVGTGADTSSQVPIHYRRTTATAAWKSTPSLSTDLPYGDFSNDGKPDAAVGRLPVDNAQQLRLAVEKIIAYETNQDFGRWRGQMSLVGGVGGFGMMIDTAIESVTRSIVTGVLPAQTRTHVRFGSPGHRFYPKSASFTQAVLEDYHAGSRFWVYAGHGQVTELDRVPQNAEGIPVLDSVSVQELRAEQANWPIGLMLACFTGAMDASEDCIAETMWLQPSGPIAVIAGSRVTMPYGNATAAVGLIDAIYDQQQPRLGDAWASAVRSMQQQPLPKESNSRMLLDGLAMMVSPAGSDLVAERDEHTMLYNLIGDPTLVMKHAETVSINVSAGFDPGKPVKMIIQSSIDGDMTITIQRPLGSEVPGDPNDLTIATSQTTVSAGQSINHSIIPPSDITGPIIIRVHVAGQDQWASEAAKTMVRKAN